MEATVMTKRIMVTGGAGFVGSHLCERLLADGHSVICLDNFCTGPYKNIEPFFDRSFELCRKNVINLSDRDTPDVDEIYNLACPASPVHYQKDPIFTWETCVFGASAVLEFAAACGAKVLQASTSEIYGEPFEHPQNELSKGYVNTVGIRSCYDEGKRAAETLFADYRRSGIDARIVRIFNTYGPRMQVDDGRVVSNFICQALRNESITVYGDGRQTRSLCYVSDLVDGLVRAMEKPYPGVMNLGNPDETSVYELAGEIISLTGSASEIRFHPLPSDDPTRRKPNINKAMLNLDWWPVVERQTGLLETIEYFRSVL
jgi:UDP-glucuronate decarboxylase